MMDILYKLTLLFAMFIIYSFIGWIIEMLLTLYKHQKIVNRGFLIGPIIPIWGFGAILITLLLKPSDSIFNLLVSSAFIGAFLEYVVNYLMEKIFKARWWDYSHLPFNVNGRVWLGSSIFFAMAGFIVINLTNPVIIPFLKGIPHFILYLCVGIVFALSLTDFIVSCNIIKRLTLSAESIRKDCTEEISKKVETILAENSIFFRRLLKSFPDINFSTKIKK